MNETTGAELRFENVTKRFDDVLAVNDLTYESKGGELLFLLGPSGCGKTTTLRLIAGHLTPDEGIITIDGSIMNNVPAHKRPTATVFQTWALFPHKNVFDNIAFGLRMRKVPKEEIREKVKEYLDLVRLPGYENRMPSQMSGGEQQRVALARSLIVEPKILLLDEPLSNLDLMLRLQMRVEIKQIQRKIGVTTIFVTHDQTEAMSMADRIALMMGGRILELGTPVELYDTPKAEFTARFLGETNYIKGNIISIDRGEAIVKSVDGLCFCVLDRYGLKVGDSVSTYIRPEDTMVTKTGTLEGENVFTGEVFDKSFRGSNVRLYVKLDEGGYAFVDQQVASEGEMAQLGDRVAVQLKKDRCLCFPKE